MGPVEHAIRTRIGPSQELRTPGRAARFTVGDIDERGVVLLLGNGEWPTRLSWECLEGIPRYLSGGSWVPIGTTYQTESVAGTLDAYLKACSKTATAGWVAVLLEQVGVVEVDRSRPLKVRLRSAS